MMFNTPCKVCGEYGICQPCQDDMEDKINIASGEDVCLTSNSAVVCYKDEGDNRGLPWSPSSCEPVGSSVWDTIRMLKPILDSEP